MITTNALALLIDDLAAHWTEPTLAILKAVGLRKITVEAELDAWRALKTALNQELRWQRSFRVSTLVSFSTLMEQVLRVAAEVIARKWEPEVISYEFERIVRRAAGERRGTDAERRLYARIVGLPHMHAAFKPPTRSDLTPHLRVSPVAS